MLLPTNRLTASLAHNQLIRTYAKLSSCSVKRVDRYEKIYEKTLNPKALSDIAKEKRKMKDGRSS
jgi:hypothetical protein